MACHLRRLCNRLEVPSLLSGRDWQRHLPPVASLLSRWESTSAPSGEPRGNPEASSAPTYEWPLSGKYPPAAAPWTPTSHLQKRKTYFKRAAHLMQCLEAEREQELQRQHNRPVITSGDIVKVVYKNATQPSRPLKFTAVCAVVRHKGPRTSMILMRSIDGEIVEYDLPLYSPWLEDISVVGRVRPEKKYLRSRLYYLKSDGKKNKRWFLIRPPHAHFPKEINNR